MAMSKPPPIHWVGNPNTIPPPNYDITSPLLDNGTNFPCQGFISLFDTSEGASVESWPAGSNQTFVIGTGTVSHNGGSCQVSISEDKGVTWKALKTLIGNCPVPGKVYTFTVPKEAKLGKVIFAWTWFSNTRRAPEMYMNCAAVTITGTGGDGLSHYPDMFEADIGNGCSTLEGDTLITNPGADVEIASNATTVLPSGTGCPSATPLYTPTSTTSTASLSTSNPGTSGSTATKSTSATAPAASATSKSAAVSSPISGHIMGPIFLAVLLATFSLFSSHFVYGHR